MKDIKAILKDMVKQRRVQVVTLILSSSGIIGWLMGYQLAAVIAALGIILFAISTIRWIDDEEELEKIIEK
ncbi:hypothetical protein CUJ83_11350 [Methanocella sp. CWC-04]|uniref:Uncharacterized protein n=1 Tax=Methanooceanicella nereidis TaxID=2052831 RepID=A0AAP2RDH3_9EURY|nr:hypothetical protein [Methanocella sp. CWC-04]MCD1295594.1 hypothetical protein [Methanocella sp. CWC-04]